MSRLKLKPITLRAANDFIKRLHRHHDPDTGHKFSVSVRLVDELVGVAICGRPKARMTDAEAIAEVTRLCTDGTKNACSILYAACARICEAMGYEEIQTFILASEPGTSLRAAGWELVGPSSGGRWSRPSRSRERNEATEAPKMKWRKVL